MIITIDKDVLMMRNPHLWASCMLPLTHRTKMERDSPFPLLGVLVDGKPYGVDGLETTVFLANIGEVTMRTLHTCERIAYASAEDIAKDWRVD